MPSIEKGPPWWQRVLFHETELARKGWKGKAYRHLRPQFQEREIPPAKLLFFQNIPIAFHKGTLPEMAKQEGLLFQDTIPPLFEFYLSLLMDTEKRYQEGMAFVRSMEPFLPFLYREAMAELASVLRLSYEEVLFAHTFLDLFHTNLVACSTIGLLPSRTGGKVLFGRNLDFPALGFVHRYSIVQVFEGEGVQPFVAVGWPGLLGVLTGWNASGVTLAIMSIHFDQYRLGGASLLWTFRKILEEAESAEEAWKILSHTPFAAACNLMVADPTTVWVAELSPGRERRRFPKPNGWIVSTNHYQSPSLRRFIPSGTHLSSYVRCFLLEYGLSKAPSRLSTTYLWHLLRTVSIPGINLQAMVITPEEKSIELSLHSTRAAWGKVTRLTWETLFS